MKKYIFLLIFSLSAVIIARADVLDVRASAPKGGQAVKMSQDFNAKRQYKPAILLLIRERIKGETQSKAWWIKESTFSRVENSLKAQFNMLGYQVIEPSKAYDIIFKTPAFGNIGITDSQAITLAKQLGADYVLIGEALVSSQGIVFEASHNKSYSATLKAELLSVKGSGVRKKINSSGENIAPEVYSGMSEALNNAAREAALTAVAAIKENQAK